MTKATRNIFKTMLLVSAMFMLCWTWAKIYYLLYNLGLDLSFTSAAYYIGNHLGALNQMVNPVIYVVQYQAFQEAVRRLFCKNASYNEKHSNM